MIRKRRDTAADHLPPALKRKVALTRAGLAWERLWPELVAPLSLTGVYGAVALVNGWQSVPAPLHWLALAGTLGGSAWLLIRNLRSWHWPETEEALRRIERQSGLRHRPLSALADDRADFAGDRNEGSALWAAHKARLEGAMRQARLASPRSRAPETDRYALRGAAFLLVTAALVHAGRDAPARLADNLLPGTFSGSSTAIAYDAWITPPAYTGVPPLFLNSAPRGEDGAPAPVSVPTGSELTARIYGAGSAEARLGDDDHPFADAASGAHEIALKLTQEGTLALAANGRVLDSYALTLTPDHAPQITFTDGDALSVTPQLTLAVGYDLLDDYGITQAEMRITLPDPDTTDITADGDEGDGTASTEIGALAAIEPPVLKLPLPSPRVTEAEAEFTYKDLTSHPWAGLQVAITLAAFDEAGQEGLSGTRIMRLPQRRFTNPVARAVIEQRQRLARKPDDAPRVARALNALTLHADRYYETATDYLPLRAAYWRLKGADHEGDLDGIYELLWDVALHFEDGNLSLAETALRDAQDALMDALANGAPDAEIDRLMQELRQAMDEFLQALAQQQMQAGPNGDTAQLPPDAQMIERGDLEDMLDALQDLAQSGSRDAARQLLSELQRMMENLASGTPGQMAMTPPQSAMNDAIGQMGEIIDQQRALQDETVQQGNSQDFQAGGREGDQQGGSQGGNQAGKSQPGAGPNGELQRRQGGIRDELSRLREGLDGSGVSQPSALGRAERAMQDAEDALAQGDTERAARKQGEAIENLRDGAQALAETLLEDLAMGDQQGQDQGRGGEGRDPLGRPQRSSGPQQGDGVEVPDETDIQRARRILEELQRRAGDRSRPPVELDYLNRLLQRF